jgi:PII-like signaling protein
LSLSEDTPLLAVAVGERGRVEGLVEEVESMASEGLIVVEAVDARTTGPATSTAAVVAAPVVGVPKDEAGAERVKVTIWGPRTGPTAPHLGAVAALRRHGAESATVLLGVDGVIDGERRRARFVAGNRGVPAVTVGVGRKAAIDAALAEVDGAAHLVTVEAVVTYCRIARVSHHGKGGVARKSVIDRVNRHDGDATRVALVTSEVASRGAHPVYLELIHQLRREGAPGATAQRGVWGFRGEGEPHGDRVLALRRDVPLVVEVVDAPERAERWLELTLEFACEGDVVYVQSVPETITLV